MYNTKKIIKNAFRITKVRGESAVRLRVPGGDMEARHLDIIRQIAEKFGSGTIHITTRQGYEIPGVKLYDIEKIKVFMSEMIGGIEKESGLILEKPEAGYPEAGTRNVCACVGNRVCQFANADTTLLAKKIERVIYPNSYHLKVAVTGCPNDCIKVHMNDIGIISNIIPEYEVEKCIHCEACLDNCKKKITNSLYSSNYQIVRDEKYCIKCGECILKCPVSAFSRGKQLFRIVVGGRTGKRNPRLASTFVENASENVVLAICKNVYNFINNHIDKSLPKEHMGYILDRASYDVFKTEVLTGIQLNQEAVVSQTLNNSGYFYQIRP